jgi:hypothetical protein
MTDKIASKRVKKVSERVKGAPISQTNLVEGQRVEKNPELFPAFQKSARVGEHEKTTK